MDSPTYTLMQPQTLQAGLGFRAYSVRVDNPSALQLFFPDANVTIRPGTVGAIVQLPGSATASCQATLPTGAASNGLAATLVFSEQKQPTVTGSSTLNVTSGGPLTNAAVSSVIAASGNIFSDNLNTIFLPGHTYEILEIDMFTLSLGAVATTFYNQTFLSPTNTLGQLTLVATSGGNTFYQPATQYKCQPPPVWVAPPATYLALSTTFGGAPSGSYLAQAQYTIRERV